MHGMCVYVPLCGVGVWYVMCLYAVCVGVHG